MLKLVNNTRSLISLRFKGPDGVYSKMLRGHSSIKIEDSEANYLVSMPKGVSSTKYNFKSTRKIKKLELANTSVNRVVVKFKKSIKTQYSKLLAPYSRLEITEEEFGWILKPLPVGISVLGLSEEVPEEKPTAKLEPIEIKERIQEPIEEDMAAGSMDTTPSKISKGEIVDSSENIPVEVEADLELDQDDDFESFLAIQESSPLDDSKALEEVKVPVVVEIAGKKKKKKKTFKKAATKKNNISDNISL